MAHARKRFTAAIFAFIITVSALFGVCCADIDTNDVDTLDGVANVVFFDVGNGDATFIKFPDGKTMLIDCGKNSQKIYADISAFLNKNAAGGLDYFVLTLPDEKHIGNAENILNDFNVKKIFSFKEENGYCVLPQQVKQLAESKGIPISVLYFGDKLVGENYYAAVLSPEPASFSGGVYADLLLNGVSEKTVKNISPIIYFQIAGVRFLFTADAGSKAESKVIQNYRAGTVGLYFSDVVSLENVDFLKVADHGSKNATSSEFISLVSPDNAVISCGKDAFPDQITLLRLARLDKEINVLRTDACGNITLCIAKDGKYQIKTQLF